MSRNYKFHNKTGLCFVSFATINWLKQHNLRKVQYLAGHRYISSTECYQQDDLESLHKTINIYHPFS